MVQIDYSKIPYKEKRSTGEYVESNAFYMPKVPEPDCYEGYEALDFFGLEFVHYEEKEKERNKINGTNDSMRQM